MSSVEPTAKLVTATDLMEMPEDGYCYELVRGCLVRDLPPGARHGSVVARFGRRLGTWAEERGAGEVFGVETGFQLQSDPDTVRAPDVAFVSSARLPDLDLPQYLPAPDLAVEVLSPSDRQSAVEEKIRDYFGAGTAQVWIVSPTGRTVTVYRSVTDVRIHTEADTIVGDGRVQGFQLHVADLFRRIPRT